MDFSVVIPTFNSSNTIGRTLNSVKKAAGNRKFEIIIVDDKSDDLNELKAMLADFPEAKLIEKEVKTNASDSRNIGILESQADIVFLLDSDDWFTPDYVCNRLKFASINKGGVIFGRYKVLVGEELLVANIPEYKKNEDMRDYLFSRGGDFRSSLVTINKKFYQGTLFDKKMNKHQDWGFSILSFDAGEEILFDNTSGVIINAARRAGRMSTNSNLTASSYFINNYLVDAKHINSFCIKQAIGAMRNKDFNAKKHFLSLAERSNLTGREFVKYWLLKLNLFFVILKLKKQIKI